MICFTVPGPPQPLHRHRVTNAGGFARSYDPAANRTNKATLGFYAKQAMNGDAPFEGPLKLEVIFYVQRPKSKTRKKPPDPFPYPDSKPDLDNLIKLVCDSLNGIAWKDDKQVCKISAAKRWGTPGTAIAIAKLET